MASVIKAASLHLSPSFSPLQDPTNVGRPLIDSAGPICAAIFGYLAIVFMGLAYHSGRPSDAANKPKKDSAALRVVMVLHNIFLIVLSAGMAAGASIEAYKGGYRFWGQDYTPKVLFTTWP